MPKIAMTTYAVITGSFRASNGHDLVSIRWGKGPWKKIEPAVRRLMKKHYDTPFVRRGEQTYYVVYDDSSGKVWDNGNYDRFNFDGKDFVLDKKGSRKPPKPKTLYLLPKGTEMVYWAGGSILHDNTVTRKTEHDMYGFIDTERDNGIVSFRVVSLGDFYCNVPRKALKKSGKMAEYDFKLGRHVFTDKASQE